jgi:hypothetical protein
MNNFVRDFSIGIFLTAINQAWGYVGIPVKTPGAVALKALEITLQSNQLLLAATGAALAYLLAHGSEILEIFKKNNNCWAKITLITTPVVLIGSTFILFWDYHTVVHQLRNGFLDTDKLLNEWVYLGLLILGLLLFIFAAYFIWKEKKR